MVSVASCFGLKTRVGMNVFVSISLRAAPKLVVRSTGRQTSRSHIYGEGMEFRHRFEVDAQLTLKSRWCREPELSNRGH